MQRDNAQDLHSWLKKNLTLGEYLRLYTLMNRQIEKIRETAERLEAKPDAE